MFGLSYFHHYHVPFPVRLTNQHLPGRGSRTLLSCKPCNRRIRYRFCSHHSCSSRSTVLSKLSIPMTCILPKQIVTISPSCIVFEALTIILVARAAAHECRIECQRLRYQIEFGWLIKAGRKHTLVRGIGSCRLAKSNAVTKEALLPLDSIRRLRCRGRRLVIRTVSSSAMATLRLSAATGAAATARSTRIIDIEFSRCAKSDTVIAFLLFAPSMIKILFQVTLLRLRMPYPRFASYVTSTISIHTRDDIQVAVPDVEPHLLQQRNASSVLTGMPGKLKSCGWSNPTITVHIVFSFPVYRPHPVWPKAYRYIAISSCENSYSVSICTVFFCRAAKL